MKVWLIFLLVVPLISCKKTGIIAIPSHTQLSINIDGQFTDEAWSNSKTIQISPGNILHLIQDEAHVYIGIQNKEEVARYVDLYIYNDSIGALNLHASMQLGERFLEGDWNENIPEWDWGNNENWSANRVEVVSDNESIPFFESVKSYEGFEFQILKKKIKSNELKIRIEIKDFMGESQDVVYPTNSGKKNKETWSQIYLQ